MIDWVLFLESIFYSFISLVVAFLLLRSIEFSQWNYLKAISLFCASVPFFYYASVSGYFVCNVQLLLYQSLMALLFVSAHTDFQALLISRFVTLFCVPIVWFLAHCNFLVIAPLESILGSIFALLFLFGVARLARWRMQQEALGQGDVDLFVLIGALFGIAGCWRALLFGSVGGSLLMVPIIGLSNTHKNTPVPLGTFLVFGAALEMMRMIYFSHILSF